MTERRLSPGRIVFICLVGVSILLRVAGVLKSIAGIDAAVFITLIGGSGIFYEAFAGLLRRRISADLAVSIAALAALYIGESLAAAEVILIMLVGGALERAATGRTVRAIEMLARLAPQQTLLERDGRERTVSIDEVRPGDTVILRPGERIAVDGRLSDGRCLVDESALTGEAMPVEKLPGERMLAGTFVSSGTGRILVESVGAESVLGKVVDLVREAQEKKAPTERTADRYVKFFVPFVLFAALATFLITRDALRAVAVLIVACPCALVLATPTAVVSAMGRLAREGILVRSGEALELAGKVNCVMFDKTGTLTQGKPRIRKLAPSEGVGEEELLRLAAAAELRSEHLLASVIVSEARARGVAVEEPREFNSLVSKGVVSAVAGRNIVVGSEALMEESGVSISESAAAEAARMERDGMTVVFVGGDKKLVGIIGVGDEPRPEAAEAVRALESLGVARIGLVTGDSVATANTVAREVGIREVAARLLPQDKVKVISDAKGAGSVTAMVGDGVNDAPALSHADVGIAMGGIGTDISIEAGDVVVMTDQLTKIPTLILVARNSLAVIKENILGFAIGFNVVAMFGASWGLVAPIAAAIVHQVSSLLVVLNSLRLLSGGRLGRKSLVGVLQGVAELPGGILRRLGEISWGGVWRSVRRYRRGIVGGVILGALLIYFGCGLYKVRPEEVAVVLRFGAIRSDGMKPGLHYHLPWPVEGVKRVALKGLRRVEVGYTAAQAEREVAAVGWTVPHGAGQAYVESLAPTGDENLLIMAMTVQYSVSDAARFLFGTADPDAVVRKAAESALRTVVAGKRVEEALTLGRPEIEEEAAAILEESLGGLDIGVQVEQLRLTELHPPSEVIEAYRHVASASEERDTLVDLAEAYHNRSVIMAKGEARAEVLRAEAFATWRVAGAEGESCRFTSRLQAYLSAPEVTRMRLFVEAMEAALAEIEKYVLYAPAGRSADVIFLPGIESAVPMMPALTEPRLPALILEEEPGNAE